jgi:hypothetical protein
VSIERDGRLCFAGCSPLFFGAQRLSGVSVLQSLEDLSDRVLSKLKGMSL